MSTSTPTIRSLPRPLAKALEAYQDRLDLDAITNAYELAVEAHTGQTRASGDEYIIHPIEVATITIIIRIEN